MTEGDGKPPFAAHGTYYIALKLVVLALALALATRLIGLW